MDQLKILFVEDLQTDYELAQWHLKKDGLTFIAICVDTQPAFLNALTEFQPDLIISDYSMPEFNGLQALQITLENSVEKPFIVLTGSLNEETAVECMRAGASDYVLKEKMHHLPFSVRETLKRYQERRDKILAEKQLQESEAKFREVFDSANVGKAIVYLDQKNVVNQTLADMLGYTIEELENLDWRQLTPAEDLEEKEEFLGPLFKGEIDATRYDKRYIHKNGSNVWVDISVKSHKDHTGKPEYFISTIVDISEKKKTEDQLRASENRFRILFDQAPVGYQSLNENGEFIHVNQTWLEMMGYERDEVIGTPFSNFVAPSYVESQKRCFQRFKGQGSIHVEFDMIKKDNSFITVSFEGRIGYDENGNFRQTHCIMQDITEKKKSDLARIESEKRYRSLFEDSPVSIWEEDFSMLKNRLDQLKEAGIRDFRKYYSDNKSELLALADLIVVTDVNQETLRLFGAETKEDLKKSITNIYTEKSISQFLEEVLNIVDGKKAFEVEFTNKKLNGEILDFTAKWAVVPGFEDDYSKVLISMLDITDRKKAEEALRENEKRYRSLFNDSPVAIYEEDFSEFKVKLDEIKRSGITDFREYLETNPDQMDELVNLIKVTDANQEALKTMQLSSIQEFKGQIIQVTTPFRNDLLIDEFVNLFEGLTKFQTETNRTDNNGNNQYLKVFWAAAPGYEESLAKVIVTVVDITERKELERRQQKRLLEMEAMDKITTALREANNKEEALPIFLKETLMMMQVEMGCILLHNPTNDVLRISDAIGLPEVMLEVEIPLGEGLIGNVFLTGETIHSPNLFILPTNQAVGLSMHPALGGVCVPIQSQEEILGVLVVVYPDNREIRPEDVRMLEAFARIAGITLHRMNLYEDTLVHLKQLQVQRTIDQTIASIFDLNLTLEIICTEARNYLKASAAGLLLFNPIEHTLNFAAEKGFRSHLYKNSKIPLGAGPAGKAALTRELIHVKDLYHCDPPFKSIGLLKEENFVSYLGIPLVAKGELKGVMEIFFHNENEYDPQLSEFINSLAYQTAIAIDNLQLFENLQRSNQELVQAYDATIEGWSRAMDLRDKETEEHTKRVTEMAVQISRILDIREDEIVHIRRGALLHDIGKMGVPDEILRKPGPLTPEEWLIMKQHPVFAYEMIAPIDYLKRALDIPYCHHEKWDGSGYPRGLKGEEIPLAGRIFAVIDVWDALSSDRPYRKAWDKEKVRKYIEEQSGTHFDPEVVRIFLEVIESEDWQG